MHASCGLRVMCLLSVFSTFNFCFELHQLQNFDIRKMTEGGVGLLIVVLPKITCSGGPDNK